MLSIATTVTFLASLMTAQALTGIAFHPNGNAAKCVEVQGTVWGNGTPVQINDCNGSPQQRWTFSRGVGHVQLNGTNFCLDAGSNPGNNVKAKIWTCYDGLAAQQWNYASDDTLSVANGTQCLDLTDGNLADGTVLQTYQCFQYNTNQKWTTNLMLARKEPPQARANRA